MVIYRPHRSTLDEAMKLRKEFDSFEDLQNYIVNELKDFINLKPKEVIASNEAHNDERIGWKDSDYICIVGYDKIEDKAGFEKYFGGKFESKLCIGMFATDYEETKWEEYLTKKKLSKL